MGENYYNQRNADNIVILRRLIRELPTFCQEFFIGVENNTSILTRKGYAYDFRIFFNFLSSEIREFYNIGIAEFTLNDMQKLTASHIELFLNYLNYYSQDGKYYSNNENGKARKLASLKSMFKYFYNKDKLNQNVTAKVAMPKIHEKPIIRLETDEVVRLLDFIETNDGMGMSPTQSAFMKNTKERDLAMLTLFLGTGIRISECVGLNIDDIDFNINGFKVTRKGGSVSILYFSNEVASAMSNYLEYRKGLKNVDHNEKALFLSLQKQRISIRAVQDLVKKYSKFITPLKKITPHKLRSTYGTSLYHETQDIYVVADVLGHKDVNTTKKHYASISDEIRRNAANKVKLRDDE